MASIVLFGSTLSPFVEKVRRALVLKKIDHEIVGPTGLGDFKKWSPTTRKMPVLEIDGEKIYDSTFICRRLDELHPQPPLLSSDPAIRARQRMLEDWSDESLYWHVMALRWSPKNGPASLDQISAGIPAIVRPIARVALKRGIGAAAGAQGLGRLPDDVLVRELGARLDDLLVLLGDSPFFYAEEPSVADLAIFGMLESGMSGPTPEINQLVNERPAAIAYLERVRAATGG